MLRSFNSPPHPLPLTLTIVLFVYHCPQEPSLQKCIAFEHHCLQECESCRKLQHPVASKATFQHSVETLHS